MHEPVFLLRLFPLFSVYNLYPPPLYFTLHLKACSAAIFFQQNINICIAYSTRLKVNQPTYCLAPKKNYFLVQQDKKGVSYIRIKCNNLFLKREARTNYLIKNTDGTAISTQALLFLNKD